MRLRSFGERSKQFAMRPRKLQAVMSEAPSLTVTRSALPVATSVESMRRKPLRVLYIDHTAALGGGELALLDIVRNLDPARVEPVVMLFADGPLAERLRAAGVETHIFAVATVVLGVRKEASGAIFSKLGVAARSLLAAA